MSYETCKQTGIESAKIFNIVGRLFYGIIKEYRDGVWCSIEKILKILHNTDISNMGEANRNLCIGLFLVMIEDIWKKSPKDFRKWIKYEVIYTEVWSVRCSRSEYITSH